MSLEKLIEAYAPERFGRKYKFRDLKVYTLKGYHRGQDIREQNAAKTKSIVTDVRTVSAGVVDYIGRPNKLLGLTIRVDTGRAKKRYEFHSHNAGVVVKLGDKVEPGEKLARNADADENPGTAWGGPHDHLVISDSPDGAWQNRAEYDPAPVIRAAVAAAKAQLQKAAAAKAEAVRVAALKKLPRKAYVVTTTTWLRDRPIVSRSNAIKPIPVGQRLSVLKVSGSWATVLRYNGEIAYVWAARLTPEKLTAARPTRLRKTSSPTSTLLQTIPLGTAVRVIGPLHLGRLRVKVGKVTGWIFPGHFAAGTLA